MKRLRFVTVCCCVKLSVELAHGTYLLCTCNLLTIPQGELMKTVTLSTKWQMTLRHIGTSHSQESQPLLPRNQGHRDLRGAD